MTRFMLNATVVVALALMVSACSSSTTSFGPSAVMTPPSVPPEWSQANPLIDPKSNTPAEVTVALLRFTPPIGSRVTPTVGFPPISPDICAGNRCFTFELEACNRTSFSKTFGLFWSSDGVKPLASGAGLDEFSVPAGGCIQRSNGNMSLFFSPAARWIIVAVMPAPTPGWRDTWPKFSFDFGYTN